MVSNCPPTIANTSSAWACVWAAFPRCSCPRRRAEVSVWYEPTLRDHAHFYGFDDDRRLRALLPGVLGPCGARLGSERLTLRSYRRRRRHQGRRPTRRLQDRRHAAFFLEFPLGLPGYFNGELTVQRFALFGGRYSRPWAARQDLDWELFAYSANVTFLPGLDQPRPWNSGVGAGLDYKSKGGVWLAKLDYGYGIDAIRSGGRGAHSVAIMMQFDLRPGARRFTPRAGPTSNR